MKITTAAIATVGFFIMGISWIQWFFMFPDPSQLFLGTTAAFVIFFDAWIYEKLTYLFQKTTNVEHKIDSIVYPKK